jgi:succinoglycan biosynthesis protein ExoL
MAIMAAFGNHDEGRYEGAGRAMLVTYLLPVVSQARYRKRITALDALGVAPQIMAFERQYYPGKPWSCGYESLGRIQHGRYGRRVAALLKAVPIVRRRLGDSVACYAFGLDMLLVGWLATRCRTRATRLVYEVGDVRQAFLGCGVRSRLWRLLERQMLWRTDLLVVTSEAYITGYFRDIQRMSGFRYLVIENKLDSRELTALPPADASSDCPASPGGLQIGYFGLIRCRRSWDVLKRVAARSEGRVGVSIRGIPMEMNEAAEEIARTPHVKYGGPYVWPDDLAAMYQGVDMVWAAHYHASANYQWARANRFYEACYFRRPMITQRGTQDAKVVELWGIGKSIDLLAPAEAIDQVLNVSPQDVAQWRKNLLKVPTSIYVQGDEHERLAKSLSGARE